MNQCLEFDHYPNLSEGADSVGGQLRGDKNRVPLQWRNQFWQSLEEGAGERCSVCGVAFHSGCSVLVSVFAETVCYIFNSSWPPLSPPCAVLVRAAK